MAAKSKEVNTLPLTMISVKDLEYNTGQIKGLPSNPRLSKDYRYTQMKKSIEESPEMLYLREVLVYPHGDKFVAIGGNLRLRACKDLGFEEIPCKILPKDTPSEKLREYSQKDNVSFGENDVDRMLHE